MEVVRNKIGQMAGDSGQDVNHSEPEGQFVSREMGLSFHEFSGSVYRFVIGNNRVFTVQAVFGAPGKGIFWERGIYSACLRASSNWRNEFRAPWPRCRSRPS